MFDWLKGSDSGEAGIEKMAKELERMLREGRHAFDLACSALIAGAEPEAVRQELLDTDRRIDDLEMSIRRQIVVHASVHGASQIPEMMILMSVAKDAERIGDYAKNLFGLCKHHTARPGEPHHDELRGLHAQISSLLEDAAEIHSSQDREAAQAFIQKATEPIDACKERMVEIFQLATCTGQDAMCVLAFRHMRRVAGHVQNVITGVVNPIDKIDFHDEPKI
jgi:phosphate transport system protein